MIQVICSAVIPWEKSFILVRKNREEKWHLPAATMEETKHFLAFVKKMVFEQTGYKAKTVRLFRIINRPTSDTAPASVTFVFGCDIEAVQLATPTRQVNCTGQHEIEIMSVNGKLRDDDIAQIVTDYATYKKTHANNRNTPQSTMLHIR